MASLLALVATSLVAPSPAKAADSIAAKRRQASRLADSIDALGEKESILAEDYDAATVRLEELRGRVNKAKQDAVSAESHLGSVAVRARKRAVQVYSDPIGAISITTGADDLGQAEQRRVLREIATGEDATVLDRLRVAREDLQARRNDVIRAEAAATQVAKSLVAKRRATDALLVRQQKQLDQTKGELGQLIVEEERRRAAAEAKRAKAELARRQAVALAAFEAARVRAAQEAAAQASARTEKERRARAALPLRPFERSKAAEAAAKAVGGDPLVLPPLSTEPPVTPGAGAAIAFARTQLGKPYRWGAAGPNSYDCSGLLLVAWRSAGRSLPHSSRALFAMSTHIPVSSVRPGDLVFYGSPIHHVGMYVGNGQMIEAPRTGLSVRYASIFRRNLVGVGRL